MASRKSARAEAVGVECIIPILNVSSVKASIRYYVDVLGFKVDWGGNDSTDMASVSRDGKAIITDQLSLGVRNEDRGSRWARAPVRIRPEGVGRCGGRSDPRFVELLRRVGLTRE